VSIAISAGGLRKIADALDKMIEIEASTGIELDGGHMGYLLASLPASPDGTRPESLRIVRTVTPGGDQGGELVGYAIEVEVP
jgi:hypothetical protein